jgi:hypothetical protein
MSGNLKEVNHYGARTVNASNKNNQLFCLSSIAHVVDGSECVAEVWVSEPSMDQD